MEYQRLKLFAPIFFSILIQIGVGNEPSIVISQDDYDNFIASMDPEYEPCPVHLITVNCSMGSVEATLKDAIWGDDRFDYTSTAISGNVSVARSIASLGILSNCSLEWSRPRYDLLGRKVLHQWNQIEEVAFTAKVSLQNLEPRRNYVFRISCILTIDEESVLFSSNLREVYTAHTFSGPERVEIYHSGAPFGMMAISSPYLTLRWTPIADWPGQPMLFLAKCLELKDETCRKKCETDIELCESCLDTAYEIDEVQALNSKAVLLGNRIVPTKPWKRVANVHWASRNLEIAQVDKSVKEVVCSVRGRSVTAGMGEWSRPATHSLTNLQPPPMLLVAFHIENDNKYGYAGVDLSLLGSHNQSTYPIHFLDKLNHPDPIVIDFAGGVMAHPRVHPEKAVSEAEEHETKDFCMDLISSRHFEVHKCYQKQWDLGFKNCIHHVLDSNKEADKMDKVFHQTRNVIGNVECDSFGTRLIWTESQDPNHPTDFTLKWSLMPSLSESSEESKDFMTVHDMSECRECPDSGILEPIAIDWKTYKADEFLSVLFITRPGIVWSLNLQSASKCSCKEWGRIPEAKKDNIKKISVGWHYFYWLSDETVNGERGTELKFMNRMRNNSGPVRTIEDGELVRLKEPQLETQRTWEKQAKTWTTIEDSEYMGLLIDLNPRTSMKYSLNNVSDIKAYAPEMCITPDQIVQISKVTTEMISESQVKIRVSMAWNRRFRMVTKLAFSFYDLTKWNEKCGSQNKSGVCETPSSFDEQILEFQGDGTSLLKGGFTPTHQYRVVVTASYVHFQLIASQQSPRKEADFVADFKSFPLSAILIGVLVPLFLLLLLCLCLICYLYRVQWRLRHVPRIPEKDIQLKEKLGAGHFSTVHRGLYKDKVVAVKLLKINAAASDKKGFLQEAIILGYLQHNHIVRELGVCLSARPYMIVLEFIDGGNAQKYLLKHRAHIENVTLLKIAIHICKACVYLADQGYIHRDLSAKNVLIGLEPKNFAFKSAILADFGLAIDSGVADNPYNSDRPEFPIRHAAPECFKGDFTRESDVYSFGIFLWEVFSCGRTPFGHIRDARELEFRRQYQNDLALAQPEGCPNELFALMQDCWNVDPKCRPLIGRVHKALETSKVLFPKESTAKNKFSCNGSEICLLDSSSGRSDGSVSTMIEETPDVTNTTDGTAGTEKHKLAASMEDKNPLTGQDEGEGRNRTRSNSGLFLRLLNRKRNNSSTNEMQVPEVETDSKPQVVASGYITADDYSQRIQAV